MDDGKRINITFLHFDIEYDVCSKDWLEIEGKKYCGEKGTSSEIQTPFSIITNTNSVNLRFISSSHDTHSTDKTRTGFLAIWSEYDLDTPTGCNNCDFPFMFGNTTFDTCISVQSVDDQPWCSVTPPIINIDGNKISCSDSDSSCPNTPSQTVIISPNYPLNYPLDADQVKKIDRNYTFDINCLYLYRTGHLLWMRDRG